MHLEGLVSILRRKGGIDMGLLALNGNDVLQKLVAWSDLSKLEGWNTSFITLIYQRVL